MNIKDIEIKDYTYNLPDEKIAKYPLKNRSNSKLLVYNKTISEHTFNDIPNLLPKNSLLVFNNTKVIRARLLFEKTTGAKIEIFCLEPILPSEVALSFETTKPTIWKCIVGNSKKWKEGDLTKTININNEKIIVKATRLNINNNHQEVQFSWNNDNISFSEILEALGKIPIPPYLNRETEEIDNSRYQTVYSQHKGSVAAPTAGLHFTNKILQQLEQNNVEISKLTLHVGAGTFKPVKTNLIYQHEMHTEHFIISKQTIDNLLKFKGNITATGTTSVRTLESIYWIGVKMLEGINETWLNQWEPYSLPQNYSYEKALNKIIEYMDGNDKNEFYSHTGIMIAPGYKFNIVDRLITNFHQPNSTLLLLVSAFTGGGDNWKEIYNYALNNNFRFLSYGDSSLLFRQ